MSGFGTFDLCNFFLWMFSFLSISPSNPDCKTAEWQIRWLAKVCCNAMTQKTRSLWIHSRRVHHCNFEDSSNGCRSKITRSIRLLHFHDCTTLQSHVHCCKECQELKREDQWTRHDWWDNWWEWTRLWLADSSSMMTQLCDTQTSWTNAWQKSRKIKHRPMSWKVQLRWAHWSSPVFWNGITAAPVVTVFSHVTNFAKNWGCWTISMSFSCVRTAT